MPAAPRGAIAWMHKCSTASTSTRCDRPPVRSRPANMQNVPYAPGCSTNSGGERVQCELYHGDARPRAARRHIYTREHRLRRVHKVFSHAAAVIVDQSSTRRAVTAETAETLCQRYKRRKGYSYREHSTGRLRSAAEYCL